VKNIDPRGDVSNVRFFVVDYSKENICVEILSATAWDICGTTVSRFLVPV